MPQTSYLQLNGRTPPRYEPPEYPPTARSLSDDDDGEFSDDREDHPTWYEEAKLRDYLESSDVEILVVVEGIEPYTSSTLMARHSYNYRAGDIEINAAFPPCVDIADDGAAVIDIDAFNLTEPAPPTSRILLSTPSIV